MHINYIKVDTYFFSVTIYANVRKLAWSLTNIDVQNILKLPWTGDGQKSENNITKKYG